MNFYMPTKMVVGKGCVKAATAEFKKLGQKALIVTGRTSAKKCGALDDVIFALANAGCEYVIYDKTEQNPKIGGCIEASGMARDFGAQFVIGIGGGSPLDAAKAIAVFAKNDIDEAQFYALDWNDALPIVAVGTTAGTGSEVTQVSVITNSAGMKKSIRHDLCFPVLALGDASYTMSLDDNFTRSTAADALSHCVESYFNLTATDLSSAFAIRGVEILIDAMKKVCSGAELDFKLREDFYKASLYGGLAISVTGTNFPHAMSYFLSEQYGVAHGSACAFYLPEFIMHNSVHASGLYTQFFKKLGISDSEFIKLIIDFAPQVDVTLTDEQKKQLSPRWQNNSCLKKCFGNISPEFLEQKIDKLF